jgi:hypothetical protein
VVRDLCMSVLPDFQRGHPQAKRKHERKRTIQGCLRMRSKANPRQISTYVRHLTRINPRRVVIDVVNDAYGSSQPTVDIYGKLNAGRKKRSPAKCNL